MRPTPEGTPPANPVEQLNVLQYFNPEDVLVNRDYVDLNGSSPLEALITESGPISHTITEELHTALAVLVYDNVYQEWNVAWQSGPVPGTASPLPAAGRIGVYNGGDLLRAGVPIFVARTTTVDGRAHLYLWQWDKNSNKGTRIKMTGDGGSEQDADFNGDLDVNLIDLDDDGVYEVVADNVADVRIWKWNGANYAPQGGQ